MNWGIVVAAFLAGLAGAIGGSARRGDRLTDAWAVFGRHPVRNLALVGGVALGAALAQLL